MDDLLFHLGQIPGVRAFPRRVGLAVPVVFQNGKPVPISERPIMFGIKGEADIQGWICIESIHVNGQLMKLSKPVALCFAVEVKTGTGKLSKDQMNWRDMFIRLGGTYVEGRDVNVTCQAVKRMFQW